jgi:hypothetical protein
MGKGLLLRLPGFACAGEAFAIVEWFVEKTWKKNRVEVTKTRPDLVNLIDLTP